MNVLYFCSKICRLKKYRYKRDGRPARRIFLKEMIKMVRTDQIHYGLKRFWANEQEINVMDSKLKVNINHNYYKVASVLIHFSGEFCNITKPARVHTNTHSLTPSDCNIHQCAGNST